MKRKFTLTVSIILLTLLVLTVACGAPQTDSGASTPTEVHETPEPTPTPKPFDGVVAVLLNRQNEFNEVLSEELDKLCAEKNYELLIKYANDSMAEQKANAIQTINEDANVLVIDPVDIDEMEPIIAECESVNAPIVNILGPINGPVNILIAPDYLKMGTLAAKRAQTHFASGTNVKIAVLEGSVDGFRTQMINDGFNEQLADQKNIEFQNIFCDYDQNKAYESTLEMLERFKPEIVFSHSDEMTLGALVALKEKNVSAKMITLNASSQIMRGIKDNIIDCAVYYSPNELAQKTVNFCETFVLDKTAKTQKYEALNLYVADSENVDSVYSAGDKYAKATVGGQWKKMTKTKKLTVAALLLALSVVLKAYLSFPVTLLSVYTQNLSLGPVPVIICGMLLGPVLGGICGAAADILGAILMPRGAYFPGFSLSMAIYGIIPGLFYLKNKNNTWLKTALSVGIAHILASLILNTIFIALINGTPIEVVFINRIVFFPVLLAVYLVVVYFAHKLIYKNFLKEDLKNEL